MSLPNGTERPPAGGGATPRPVPLVVSCAMGAIGLVFLVAGALLGSAALSLAGVVAGTLSLGAALYWRSMLITAWAAQKRSRGRRPPR